MEATAATAIAGETGAAEIAGKPAGAAGKPASTTKYAILKTGKSAKERIKERLWEETATEEGKLGPSFRHGQTNSLDNNKNDEKLHFGLMSCARLILWLTGHENVNSDLPYMTGARG